MKIYHGKEIMELDEKTGNVSRPAIGIKASGSWKIIGAERYNNFGYTVERVSLADIIAGKIIDWQYGNGKQKWHVIDLDHGTRRVWMSPKHSLVK